MTSQALADSSVFGALVTSSSSVFSSLFTSSLLLVVTTKLSGGLGGADRCILGGFGFSTFVIFATNGDSSYGTSEILSSLKSRDLRLSKRESGDLLISEGCW